MSWATRRPHLILLGYGLATAAAVVGMTRLRQEDDLLAFLPTGDADVAFFREVSRRFGALRVALVGVETRAPGGDVFSAAAVERIQAATGALRNVRGVDHVMSMTSLSDLVAGAAGAEVSPLVPGPPADEAARRALRAKVLSREQVAGSLVSRDGRAALIMVFLTEAAGSRQVAEELKRVAEAALRPPSGDGAELQVYLGGAPFAAHALYEEAQADVRRLSPIASLVLLLVIVIAFRDPVGVALTVGSVAFAAAVVLGAMGFLGEHFTVASATLPVILFASGSSYAVHVLGRYYLLRASAPPEAAISGALSIVRAPLFIAAATTATGFFAFVVTDIRPMRAFGIACGAGVLLCWVTALELCPAVLALWPRPARATPELAHLGSAMVRVWHWSFRRRRLVLSAALVVAVACLWPMSRVSVRMEPRAFFRPGSDPFRAESFLEERFGGSRFVQVQLVGDFNDPTTLRELGRFSDYARSLDRVTQISSILLPLELVNEGMGGPRRLPATRAQAANLYFFLESEPSLRSLITADRRAALMHVRVRGDPDEVVFALEQFVRDRLSRRPRPQSARELSERLVWMARPAGRPVADPARLEQLIGDLTLPGAEDAEWARRRALIAAATLTDVGAPPLEPALRERVLQAAAAGSPDVDRLMEQAIPNQEDARLLGARLSARLGEARRELAIERSTPVVLAAGGLPPGDARLAAEVAALLDDRLLAPQLHPAPAPLSARLAGEPLLDRGFSRAVAHNQVRCLVVSVVVVLILLYALFRSVKVAFLCMAPALLTMGAIFGVMGMLGIQIDLGTSLVASIATGAGSDFAMHYVWYLSRAGNRPLPLGHGPHADLVSRSVGPVMAVSVLLVALGFGVLALGRSAVMQLFGALAGLSMALSALLTCLLLPALIRKVLPEEGRE